MTSPTPAKRPLHTLGPGTFELEAPTSGGVGLDISCQITDIKFSAEGDSEDPTPTLCGGQVNGARTYKPKVEFTAYQDILKDGMIDWSWRNAGAEVRFTFIPDKTSTTAKVTGTVVVDPIEFGGKVGQRNTSEVEWGTVGMPTFTPADTAALEDTTPAG
ncbi:hypothetical protein [Tsukamurella strandjordii]|uniref:hypothetical protein n=1 Tax=Tsukamurella strandjordii TaxID=147577 RepID=UPI0031CF7AA6